MPKTTDPGFNEYSFIPKPIGPADPNPPLTRDEFKKRYYSCYKGKRRNSHFIVSCRKKCRNKNDALEKVPKRDREVNEEGDSREFFWGLRAAEEIQFIIVSIYIALVFVTVFVFWALWLTTMDHPGDLQNASVPFTTAMGLLSIFVFLLSLRQVDG